MIWLSFTWLPLIKHGTNPYDNDITIVLCHSWMDAPQRFVFFWIINEQNYCPGSCRSLDVFFWYSTVQYVLQLICLIFLGMFGAQES